MSLLLIYLNKKPRMQHSSSHKSLRVLNFTLPLFQWTFLSLSECLSTYKSVSRVRKRYKSGDDPGGHPQSKGAAENSQENPKRLEHGHDLEGVTVVALWLVGDYGPEIYQKTAI